jgi:hypothetical protein
VDGIRRVRGWARCRQPIGNGLAQRASGRVFAGTDKVYLAIVRRVHPFPYCRGGLGSIPQSPEQG